jgi:DNA-directed RNA polymerase subunit H (RpoH/RPB5)
MEERALSTLKEILVERGNKGEKFDEVSSTVDETKAYAFGGILIMFSTKARLSEKDLNLCIEFSKENGYTVGLIIVSLSRPSDTVLNSLRVHIKDTANPLVQVFEIRHLQFLYGHHIKVPKHRIVTSEEIQKILKDSNAPKASVFRKIDSQDPMAKWVGARPGDLLEVTGMCESSVENKRYLFCMADVTNG